MTPQETITIPPRNFLKEIENTLRIQNNINRDKKTGETCQDRNIKQSLNIVRKLLAGAELTGMERLEKLQPTLPSNLDEAAEGVAFKAYPPKLRDNPDGANYYPIDINEDERSGFEDGFIAGAQWTAEQG